MDKLILYRELVEKLLQEHADLMNSQPVPGEEVDCIFDENREHYMMLRYGWPRGKRAYYVKLHVRIKDGKIRIEEDWTQDGIATELMDAGVPKEDIVLAFNPPELRAETGFAVA